MENNELNVTEELLQNIDAIVDLKLETENKWSRCGNRKLQWNIKLLIKEGDFKIWI